MCVTGYESECRYTNIFIYWCSVAETGKREGKGFSGSHCRMTPQVVALACHPGAGGADVSHGALRSRTTQQAVQLTWWPAWQPGKRLRKEIKKWMRKMDFKNGHKIWKCKYKILKKICSGGLTWSPARPLVSMLIKSPYRNIAYWWSYDKNTTGRQPLFRFIQVCYPVQKFLLNWGFICKSMHHFCTCWFPKW